MVPPQVSPISHASSSPRSSWSRRGLWADSTEAASSITWASTQPPMVTEPRTRPPSPTSIWAPSLRGVVPRVFTRVASATFPSDRRSWSRLSKSSDLLTGGSPLSQPQVAGEVPEAGEIVRGGEVVHQRQGGGHAASERLVRWIAKQRVQPDHPARLALERQHLRRQLVRLSGIPAVGEHDDDGASIHQMPPGPVEVPERLPDPRAPGPVPDGGELAEGLPVGRALEML